MVSNPNEEANNETAAEFPARAIVMGETYVRPAENGSTPTEAQPLPVRPAGWLNTQPAVLSHVEAGDEATSSVVEPAADQEVLPFAAPPAEQPPLPLLAEPLDFSPDPATVAVAEPPPAPPAVVPTQPIPISQQQPVSRLPLAPNELAPPRPLISDLPPLVPDTQPPAVSAQAPPAGALVLLAGEEVLMQLGALYLTNKRAILYAPTILRAAFLKDVDAVGTVTERSGGLMLILGLLGVVLAALAAYTGVTQPSAELSLGDLYHAPPLLVAAPLALLGLLALASYFFWVKRSLFLSVGGRPLIVVSITGWSSRKLTAVDSFVNAFSVAKDRDGTGQG